MVRCLTIAYVGTRYAGWQRQPNAIAVQQVIEEVLSDLLGSPTRIVGAGRTDAGVHARGQVAHLETEPGRLPNRAVVHTANQRLPDDIRLVGCEWMRTGFHARKSAAWKVYRYRLVQTRVLSPIDAPYAARVDPGLDVEAMKAAADALAGEHDFSAFALAGGAHRSPRRRIYCAGFEETGKQIVFRVCGVGFLRGMVRSLVGTLLEVGRGRRTVESFAALLEGDSRSAAGATAPAQGLTLERVAYSARERLCEVTDPPMSCGKFES